MAEGNTITIPDFVTLRRAQRTIRIKITTTCNAIESRIEQRYSRTVIKVLLEEASSLITKAIYLNEQLTQSEDDDEVSKQQERHLEYLSRFTEIKELVEQYLQERAGDPLSCVETSSSVGSVPPHIRASSLGSQHGENTSEPEWKTKEELRDVIADIKRVTVVQRPQEGNDPQAPAQVPSQQPRVPAQQPQIPAQQPQVPDQQPQVPAQQPQVPAQQPQIPVLPIGLADHWRYYQRTLNSLPPVLKEDPSPDNWIDMYCAGLERPFVRVENDKNSSIKATLRVYHGEALRWFEWIAMFHSLVHQTGKCPAEKLAILTSHLSDECRVIIYGCGGDEESYKIALQRLKQTYGRRDVMRAIHFQALDNLEAPRGNPTEFCRFAERVRGHLIDLTRIGEMGHADIIEKITLKLQLNDRLAWNDGRGTGLEHRTLNEFGSWLCNRATAYQNPYTIAAEQLRSELKSNRHRRTYHGAVQPKYSSKSEEQKNQKYFCFKCENTSHRLADCVTFKKLSVEERLALVVRRKLCFLCLGCKHTSSQCNRKDSCGVEGCALRHHVLLHEPLQATASTASARTRKHQVALGVVYAEAMDRHGNSIPINILFDECSTDTYVRAGLARRLNLSGTAQVLSIDGIGATNTQVVKSEVVQMTVRTSDGEHLTITGSTMPVVTKPVPRTDWDILKKRWSHLANLPIHNSNGGQVDILLGLDHSHLMAVIESRYGGEFEPIASRTRLGWVVRGVIGSDVGTRPHTHIAQTNHAIQQAYPDLDIAVKRLYDTESFGTEYQTDCLSAENQRAVRMLDQGIRKLETGYEAPILWKEGEPDLADNRALAEIRLRCLISKFRKDPNYEKQYRVAMQKNFDNGYAIKLTAEELEEPGPVYYIPHFGVPKAGGDGVRIVFDAAARFQGKSLNDAIISGPALQNSLPAVLIRFREGEIAWAADIQAMFSRIRLPKADRRYHRFLWVEEDGLTSLCEFTRVTFGVSCSPYVAIRTTWRAAEDAGPEFHEAASVIKRNTYVDDVLSSNKTLEEAVTTARGVEKVLKEGDFYLPEFTSNSPAFLKAIRPDGKKPETPLVIGPADETTLLGIVWRRGSDVLGFDVIEKDVVYTRVGILSQVASIFDPLGSAAPITVKGRIRHRELGIRGLAWTDKVDDGERKWWQAWFAILRQLKYVEYPRCLFPNEDHIIRIELHTFCDASTEAFAAVVYVRSIYDDGQVVIRHVKGGTKLAPTKTLSVPRLELNAALLGSRMAKMVQTELTRKVTARYFWTDSSTVRNWIRATAALYQTFVSHRIGEIQSLTEPQEWRFVPGKLNPADTATRSQLEAEAVPYIWFDGPEFLHELEESWPKDLPWMAVSDEIRSTRTHVAATESLFNWEEVKMSSEDIPNLVQLKGPHLELIKRAQREEYEEELEKLSKNKPLKASSPLVSLTPFIGTDGLLRLGGRIRRAKLPYDALHPPILPGRHPLARLIVEAFHIRLKHFGTDFVLSHIRQHFWLTEGREAVKRAQRDCLRCRRHRAKPVEQLMGDLPMSRLDAGSPPFTRAACDYFGPFEVARARNQACKRWGVLFTCLVTRAVYLDLATSLSSDDFLLVLRRFIATYGKPRQIFSDNGTNFVGADRDLRQEVEQLNKADSAMKFMQHEAIDWQFQPPATPHFGGAHESLVKVTKKALYAALETEKTGLRYPTEDTLRTILFEVAGLLNSRPLYYVSSDPDDFRPLTPNDFLNRPPNADVPAGDNKTALPNEHYRYSQRALNLFWDMWKGPYLQSLITRKKWQQPMRNLAIGDVVLEHNPQLQRGQWRTGKVMAVFPGEDGLVRAVDVEFDGTVYRRGIQKLCLLEPSSSDSIKSDLGEKCSSEGI